MTAVFLPIAKPWLDEEDVQAAGRAIRSGWVTQGPEVAAFESEFASFVGAKYACAVSSCTTALHLALLAAGVCPGDEVITVSHTFIATANAIRYCSGVPVFVDIEPETCNMDTTLLELALTSKTRALLCVHQMGMPCDMNRIMAFAEKNNLIVIEDAACAAGSRILWQGNWEPIGKPHGHIACFSFHPRKVITTGDGGMLTTNKLEYDRQFRLLRQHGMSIPDTVRHGANEVIFETYPIVGYNYRMTDIQAAVGRVQLKRLPEIVAERRRLAMRYRQLLADIPEIVLPEEPSWAQSNWQTFWVHLPKNHYQKAIMQKMLDVGIATRRGIMNIHRELAYSDGLWRCHQTGEKSVQGMHRLENSEAAQDQCIALPLYYGMGDDDQDRVIDALRQTLMEH